MTRRTVLSVLGLALLCVAAVARAQEAPGLGREIELSGLADAACRDIHRTAVNDAIARLGYAPGAEDPFSGGLELTATAALSRQDAEGATRLLVIGLRLYASQAGRLYLWGATRTAEGDAPNPDVDAVAEAASAAAEAIRQSPRAYRLSDLKMEVYQLSCTDPDSCIATLADLGYNTSPPGAEVTLDRLPAVFKLRAYESPRSVVGGGTAMDQKTLDQETLSAQENRLLIVYHASQGEQVGNLKDLLRDVVDVPADQVLIEGMVIELTERQLRELGTQWAYYGADGFKIAFEGEEDEPSAFIMSYDPTEEIADELRRRLTGTIRALIEEGEGEVLSSPSILVLNNRNAKFQVIQEVPIFQTVITEQTSKVEVDFKTAGIILNIKPRISEDGSTVAMQILVEVSEAPEEDFVIVQGQALAPVINRRIVETVARVHDNTPFIIGGLIRNERSTVEDRVPLLSSIPIIGALFRDSTSRREKREVIIVLTPRVLRGGANRPVLPKDSARFDFLDNRLFRNSYRLKAEDVLDFRFLESNAEIRETMAATLRLVRRHPEYASRSPFREMAAGIIPGEDAVVVRMLFEIARDRLELHKRLNPGSVIFFREDPAMPAGFRVWFLDRDGGRGIIQEGSPDGTFDGYFAQGYPRKVLLLHFEVNPGGGPQEALASQVAHVEWVTVQDAKDDAVKARLAEINQLGDDYLYHGFAISIESRSDLERLLACIALREMADVNSFGGDLTLAQFRVGRRIIVPELDPATESVFLIDDRVAEYFYKSDYYYESLRAKLERGYAIVHEALAREGEL